ncbi:DUF2568 domain-containing protein [Paeniglutamicibacter sp. NPDC012692]|uniref:DUF2568 domain-containing protein n=1 Tax=Paeniglutamicibacter sp. NPDC012692 TaxID=3364388 RepID=UPI003679C97A
MRVVKTGSGEAPKPAVGPKPGAGIAAAPGAGKGAGSQSDLAAGGLATSVVRPTPAMMKPHRVLPTVKAGIGRESTVGPAAPRPVAGKPQGTTSEAKPGKPAPAKTPAPRAAAPETVVVPVQPAPTKVALPGHSVPGANDVHGDDAVPGDKGVQGAKPAPAVRDNSDAPRQAELVADRAAASVPEQSSVTGDGKQLGMSVGRVPAAAELTDVPLVTEADEPAAAEPVGRSAPDAFMPTAEDVATGRDTVSTGEPAPSDEPAVAAAPVEAVEAAEPAGAKAPAAASAAAPAATPAATEVPEVADVRVAAPAEARAKADVHAVAVAALMGVSFVLEVALLGAGALWALGALSLAPVVAVLVTVIPLMVFWGLFMSPKARFRVSPVPHALLSHALFAAGTVLLVVAGHPALAIAMGALTAVSIVLTLLARGQDSVGNAAAAKRRRKSKGSGRRAAR